MVPVHQRTVNLIAYSSLGIVTGRIDPAGFGPGHGWVGVGVEIFHPANDPDPNAGSCGSQTYLDSAEQ